MFLRLSLPSLCRLPSLGGIVLAALAALVPRPAAAEAPSGGTPSQATPDAVARAESLFREGREAMRQHEAELRAQVSQRN